MKFWKLNYYRYLLINKYGCSDGGKNSNRVVNASKEEEKDKGINSTTVVIKYNKYNKIYCIYVTNPQIKVIRKRIMYFKFYLEYYSRIWM